MNWIALSHKDCKCTSFVGLFRFRNGRSRNLMYMNLFLDTLIDIRLLRL